MPTNTTNLAIPKPLGTEAFTRAAFNTILDTIDANAASKTYVDGIQPGYFVYRSGVKDSKGVYPIVDYKRTDGTLYMRSTLTNANANGNYQTDTWRYYAADGTTLVKTVTWTIGYDSDGAVTSETFV